jgi:ankyrin repeat protein
MTAAAPAYVPADDPIVEAATAAVQGGDLEQLDRLLGAHPWLADARFGDPDCHRSLLHAATDWPGHFPRVRESIERIARAGADVNIHSRFDAHQETALHWAASSNDLAALDALLDAGADIEATGAVLGGGTAMADACGFGNYEAARRLVERGAHTRLKDAAALGLMDRVRAAFTSEPGPTTETVTQALWSACAAGQLEAAVHLAERGADLNWVGWDHKTPLRVAEEAGSAELVDWLMAHGATRP